MQPSLFHHDIMQRDVQNLTSRTAIAAVIRDTHWFSKLNRKMGLDVLERFSVIKTETKGVWGEPGNSHNA